MNCINVYRESWEVSSLSRGRERGRGGRADPLCLTNEANNLTCLDRGPYVAFNRWIEERYKHTVMSYAANVTAAN